MQARTRRQREILDFIVDFVESHGYQPSYQQIANHCGLSSKGGVAKHIQALERKGLLKRNRMHGSFALEIYPGTSSEEHICEIKWLRVPGDNRTGNKEQALFVPRFLLGYLPKERIRGYIVPDDAMSKEHIVQGDVALIEEKAFARDGECVAAVVGDERVVLGNYFRKGSSVELRPANDSYEPIRERADRVKILGVFRGLMRPN